MGFKVMKLTEHCFAVTGLYDVLPWCTNAGFIAGSRKTLVIDSGSGRLMAQTIYGYAAAAHPGNEIVLINTERHLDHVGGNAYFSEQRSAVFGHASINRNQGELEANADAINASVSNKARRENEEGRIAFKRRCPCS